MPPDKNIFRHTQVSRPILVVGLFLACLYTYIICFWFTPSNIYLFAILISGQIFLVWQVSTYIFTIWNTEREYVKDEDHAPTIDVFITVAGEPTEIVEKTVRAVCSMKYPHFSVYILNDGFVAKKENWREIETLAKDLNVHCITRTVPGGAKAGNINNALRQTKSELICIFDADHVPVRVFLKETIPYFCDPKMAFIQTPQFYKNQKLNMITQGAWEQQELFFGPICKGKNNYNAATMCGTNMIIRREAFNEVGGMCEESIAEDFVTGLLMHAKGWKSLYIPKVLARGLAPEDFLSYYKQQFRWARGALDVIFNYNVFTRPGLTLAQRIQYLSSASHFLSGIIVITNALFPIIFLLTGQQPFIITTMSLAAVFLPYMCVTLYILRMSSGNTLTFRSLSFSMGGFGIHLSALLGAATGKKASFAITSKRALTGNFLYLVAMHIGYIILVISSAAIAIYRNGLTPGIANNIAWASITCCIFAPFIFAALPQREAASLVVEDETYDEYMHDLVIHPQQAIQL